MRLAPIQCLLRLAMLAAPAAAQSSSSLPPVRPLGAIIAATTEPLASIRQVRPLSDGRVLVNDGAARRVVLFDASLAHATTVIDTTSSTARAYGEQGGAIFPFVGDSSMFGDIASLSVLILSPEGKIVRVAAAPRGLGGGLFYMTIPQYGSSWDGRGGMLSQWPSAAGGSGTAAGGRGGGGGGGGGRATPAPATVAPTGGTAAPVAPAGGTAASAPPGALVARPDSAKIVRVDMQTHKIDTIAWLATPTRYTVTTPMSGTAFRIQFASNPLPAQDDWTMLPDGTIAVVRELDYHIDWYAPNGTRTSGPRIAHQWTRVTDSLKTALVDSARRADSVATAAQRVADSIAAAKAARTGADVEFSPIGGGGFAVVGGVALVPLYVDPATLPDYMPPFLAAPDSLGARAVKADADGGVWIRVNQPKRGEGGTVYDVVDRSGALVDRVQLPGGTTLVAFGPGVAYIMSREGANYVLARARIR